MQPCLSAQLLAYLRPWTEAFFRSFRVGCSRPVSGDNHKAGDSDTIDELSQFRHQHVMPGRTRQSFPFPPVLVHLCQFDAIQSFRCSFSVVFFWVFGVQVRRLS